MLKRMDKDSWVKNMGGVEDIERLGMKLHTAILVLNIQSDVAQDRVKFATRYTCLTHASMMMK